MNVASFLSILSIMLWKYLPEEMDPNLKPTDSSGCISCKKIHYDFIIVGAGSAGSVLANRLSENPDWKVLLIEAGGDEDFITDTPALTSILFRTKYDWNYTTVRQQQACYDTDGYCSFAAGHVMGGTSTMNGMDYVRGNPQDYDDWEALGNAGWSYKDVLPYFLKSENTSIEEFFNSDYHSTKGFQNVGYSRFIADISKDFIKSVKNTGIPEIDYNGRTQIGVSKVQFTINGPTRCSTSKAYLNPIRNRKNLIIFKNTEVTKILINPETKKAEGVRYIMNGKKYNIYCRKEIIISAGVLNTPKLLMLSGIGPKKHLEELGIPVIADLPVGENFVDHSGGSMYFSVDKTMLNCCTKFTNETALQYARDGLGALTSPSQHVITFLNTKNKTSNVPDITVIMGVVSEQFDNSQDTHIFIYLGNLYPKSVGRIRLQSSNYKDQPLIDPNYFGDKSDLNSIRNGILQVLKYIDSPILKKYSLKWTNYENKQCKDIYKISTIENWNCIIKHMAHAGLHGVGTARMGPKYDKTTVVDSKLKVHNIINLRVIDASIMPRITRGNPNAPVIMIGEKGAKLIQENYNSKMGKR